MAIANFVYKFNAGIINKGDGLTQIRDILLEPTRLASNEEACQSLRASYISTAKLESCSSKMDAFIQALSIASHQVADRKEVMPVFTAGRESRVQESIGKGTPTE